MFLFLVIFTTLTSFTYSSNGDSLNILAILPYEGKSHFFVFEPLLKELAARGHNVTIISHFPQEKQLKNYQDISLAGSVKILESEFSVERSYITILNLAFFLFERGIDNCRSLLENEQVQELWISEAKFDVILYEMFNSDCALGLAYQLKAPVVGLTSHSLLPWHYDRFGVSYNPSYVPFVFLEGGNKPTLYQRIERTIMNIYFKLMYRFYGLAVDQKTVSQYLPETPPIDELVNDVKCVLLYQKFCFSGSRLFPANVIEVGGYHVSKPKPLNNNLLKFIEEADNGVLYISLGSMLKSDSIPKDKLQGILRALSKIPQKIIWKWDRETLPGNPKNIYLSKWLPQNDILAHPNVVAFYTHGGLLSATEAIHHGVPLIVMPIFGDQASNAASIEETGLGVQIPVADLSEETLYTAIKSVTEPKFRENVKKLSSIWHDRPLSAMDTAVYWTEFTARNSNFTFRTKAADVPLYQYLCIDILSLFTIILLATFVVIKQLCFRKQTKVANKIKSHKRKNKKD